MNTQQKFDALIAQAPGTKDRLFYAGMRLFAEKGYANVGIRALCRAAGIKESSFYNHYPGKESLLSAIIAYYDQASEQLIPGEVELHALIERGDVRAFFADNMRRYSAVSSSVLYRTALQIVQAERFLHPAAAAAAQKTLYHLRREDTEQALRGLMGRSAIRPCNVEAVTAEYYYALQGMLDEHLLLQHWDVDLTDITARMQAHIDFFADLLRPDPVQEHAANIESGLQC